MLKSIFKQLLGLTLLVMLVFSLSTPAYAAGTITGNNTFETAYAAGNWKYSNMSTILPASETEAYYTFTANAGDKVYAKSSYQNVYAGMNT